MVSENKLVQTTNILPVIRKRGLEAIGIIWDSHE